MSDLGRVGRTSRAAATTAFAQGAVDHAHLATSIELDGAVGAQVDTGLAPGADLRVDPADGRGYLHHPPGGQGEGFGRRPGSLGHGVGNILGPLAGTGQKDPVSGGVQWP